MIVLSIFAALGWVLALLCAAWVNRYAKPFAEATRQHDEATKRLHAANEKCFETIKSLDQTEKRYREMIRAHFAQKKAEPE